LLAEAALDAAAASFIAFAISDFLDYDSGQPTIYQLRLHVPSNSLF